MGEFIDKAKGTANVAIGKAKVAVGEQTDNAKLVAKGLTQEAKGEAEKAISSIKGALGDKI